MSDVRNNRLDVRNKRSADIASDHHLLIGEKQRIQWREKRLGRWYNTHRLEDPAVQRSFVEELEIRVVDIPDGRTVEKQWTAIKNTFIETSKNNLSQLHTRRKEWNTDGIWQKIEEQREVKTVPEWAQTRRTKNEACNYISSLSKVVKREFTLADEGNRATATGEMQLLSDISQRSIFTDPSDQLNTSLGTSNNFFKFRRSTSHHFSARSAMGTTHHSRQLRSPFTAGQLSNVWHPTKLSG